MKAQWLCSVVAAVAALIVASCTAIVGPLNNPTDPTSPTYVGVPDNLTSPNPSYTTNPVLQWGLGSEGSQASPPSKYHVQVATDSSFNNIVIDDTTSNTQYTVSEALTNNTTYYWRVAAMTASGQQGQWTSADDFLVEVNATLYLLTVQSPANGLVSINGGTALSSSSVDAASGVAVNISATADSGYVFSGWSVASGSVTIGNTSSAVTTAILSNGDATVQANFQTGTLPSISYSPNDMGFSASQGGSNPSSQTLIVENSGSGSLSWTAGTTQPWLSVTPLSGTVASGSYSSATVAVNVSGLASGTYSDTITITAGGASNSPQTVPVTLTVYSSGGGTLVWSDSFESYPVGTFPSTWTPVANATDSSTNYVDNSVAYSGSQSLKLYGQVGGCWGAITDRALDATPPYVIDVDVYNGTEVTSGCHPDRGVVGIREGANWTNPGRQLIDFDQAGNITDMNGNTITSYSTGEWYSVKIFYQISGANVLATYTINGVTYPQVSAPVQSSESSFDNVELTAEEGSVWFDNVAIYQY